MNYLDISKPSRESKVSFSKHIDNQISQNIDHNKISLQITKWHWRNRVLVIKISFSLTSGLVSGLMQFREWCKGASRNSARIFGRTIGKQTTFLWHTEFSQWPTTACLSEGRHAVSMSIRTEEEPHFRQIKFLTYYRLRNKINSYNLFFKL